MYIRELLFSNKQCCREQRCGRTLLAGGERRARLILIKGSGMPDPYIPLSWNNSRLNLPISLMSKIAQNLGKGAQWLFVIDQMAGIDFALGNNRQ